MMHILTKGVRFLYFQINDFLGESALRSIWVPCKIGIQPIVINIADVRPYTV